VITGILLAQTSPQSAKEAVPMRKKKKKKSRIAKQIQRL
jgi:hypothetical protein